MERKLNIKQLHHFAYRCRDAEETRHFYEDILGLPLVHVIEADHVPSTGEYCPYVHIFFEMADGSCLAFFDLGDGEKALPSPNTPSWVNHIAVQVESEDELKIATKRLTEEGYEVLGVTDHTFVKSIYMFDPNGLRLELTTPVGPRSYLEEARAEAHRRCDAWTQRKKRLDPKKARQTSMEGQL